MEKFRVGLMKLLNEHSAEKGSNTPDFILANYLTDCLRTFDHAVSERSRWGDIVARTQIPLIEDPIEFPKVSGYQGTFEPVTPEEFITKHPIDIKGSPAHARR